MADFKGRDKVVVVGHSKLGNRVCQVTTGPCEDKVKLNPSVVGGWRECDVKWGEEVN